MKCKIRVEQLVEAARAATRFWSGAREARAAQKNSEAAYTIYSELFSDLLTYLLTYLLTTEPIFRRPIIEIKKF